MFEAFWVLSTQNASNTLFTHLREQIRYEIHNEPILVTIGGMTDLRLYLLGSPRLERGGKLVDMDTRKALALLAALALGGQEQRRETLAALLYPEADAESGRAAFRRTLSTLTHALGEGVLAARRDAVGLIPGSGLWVDALAFRELASAGSAEAALEQAVELYRGDFMAGFTLRDSSAFDDWQYRQSEELRRLLSGALERLAALAAESGDLERAIRHATRRVDLDPLLEEGQRQLMRLYLYAGQRNAALRQYRECVRVLDQELGVPPLEETTRLYQEILGSRTENARPRQAPVLGETQMPAPVLPALPVGPAPLVGREAEMAALARALQPEAEEGMFLSLEGEAGIGKTRLAEEFLALARRDGRAVIRAGCYEGEESLAYGPFVEGLERALEQPGMAARLEKLPPETLAEAARLLPSLRTVSRQVGLPPDGPGAQTRFFEALRQVFLSLLNGNVPGVLFIDDLQWADSATLDFLAYLARRIIPAGCLILAAWRGEEGPNSERLRQLQAEQQRAGRGLHLPLRRLNPTEVGRLARGLLSASGQERAPADLDRRLYAESEGLPFIAMEYLRGLKSAQGDWQMSGGVRDLLHRRLRAPGETARQLLTAAAVIGRPFDLSMLHAVSGRSEMETLTGLEELIGQGLLGERPGGYDFTHHKLREVAYAETSLARRRLLHQRVGEALAGAGSSRAAAGLAAGHFLQSGQTARAAELFRAAGEYARGLHANAEALAAFQSALAAGHPDLAGIHEACGDLETLSGNYREAIANYQAAAAFCSPGCLSNLMHKLGEVYQRLGEWDAAEAHYQSALEAAGDGGDPAWLAHLFAGWSLTSYRRGQTQRAGSLAGQALSRAQESGDPGALAQALNMMGILARADGELDVAKDFFERSLEAAGRVENMSLRVAALNNQARLLQEQGRAEEAIPQAHQALALCARMGDRHRQAAIQNNLADLYHAAGMEEEAMAQLKQAVALFAEIGEQTGPEQPEIWMLTEW